MSFGVGLFAVTPFGRSGGGAPAPSATTTPLLVTVAAAQPTNTPLIVRVLSPVPAAPVPLLVSVFSPGASPARWRPVVTLGGVDISVRLVGEIEVIATEGEARIAAFSFLPLAGVVQPAQWVGRRVTIDFAEAGTGGVAVNPQRIFTGLVDVPTYDVSTGTASVECTDQRQEVLANTPRAWFDAAIGGYYSAAVSGEPAGNLEYAEERIKSVPAALDLDAWQRPRVTAWAAATPYATLTASDVFDGSLWASMPSRADMANVIEAVFEYRYPRLRSRTIVTNWHILGDYRAKEDLPTRAMVDSALSGLPTWRMDGRITYVPPPIGSQSYNGGIWDMPASVASTVCIGWAARHRTRWVQTVTERYTVRVRNQDSVDLIGEARENAPGAQMVVEFDAGQWLDDYSTAPLLARTSYGDESHDVGLLGINDRTALGAALEAVAARAQTDIKARHRRGRAGFSVALRPDYDLAHTFAVDGQLADGRRLRATGKAVEVSHRMDIDAGEATTAVTLAISGLASVGLQPYDPPAAPAAPADPSPAPAPVAWALKCSTYAGRRTGAPAFNDDTMVGFSTNLSADDGMGTYDPFGELYPVQFSVDAPEVESAARDPLELAVTQDYAADVPQDQFEVTA